MMKTFRILSLTFIFFCTCSYASVEPPHVLSILMGMIGKLSKTIDDTLNYQKELMGLRKLTIDTQDRYLTISVLQQNTNNIHIRLIALKDFISNEQTHMVWQLAKYQTNELDLSYTFTLKQVRDYATSIIAEIGNDLKYNDEIAALCHDNYVILKIEANTVFLKNIRTVIEQVVSELPDTTPQIQALEKGVKKQ